MKAPITISITDAAGQICYALLFCTATGDIFGKDQPINLPTKSCSHKRLADG